MTAQILYFDRCQDDLVGALEWALELAKKGELISLVGVGMMEIEDSENAADIMTIRAGAWGSSVFTMVGGLESMKLRLQIDCDESIQNCITRLALEP